MTMCRASRVDKADGSDSGRVMAALSDAAVIDVTAADQSRVKAGCRTGGNHVKMPWRLSTIAGFYRYAVEEELLGRSPAARVRRPRVDYESQPSRWTVTSSARYSSPPGLGRQPGTR
jgi:site-specific recombinase XerC